MEIVENIKRGEGNKKRWRWSFLDQTGRSRVMCPVAGWVSRGEAEADLKEVVEAVINKYHVPDNTYKAWNTVLIVAVLVLALSHFVR